MLITFIFPCLANTKRLYCSTCNKNYNEQGGRLNTIVVEAKGHAYGDIHNEVTQACTTGGNIAYYKCSDCATYFNSSKEKVDEDKGEYNK